MAIASSLISHLSYLNYKDTIKINELKNEIAKETYIAREEAMYHHGRIDMLNELTSSNINPSEHWPVPEIYSPEITATWPYVAMTVVSAYVAIELGCQAIFKKSPTASLVNKIVDTCYNYKSRKLEEAEAN